MLMIKIQNPDNGFSLDTIGLIDTGADRCAVPAAYAEVLGCDLTGGPVRTINTGNGQTIAYSHTCRIDVYHTEQLRLGNSEPIYTTSEVPIDFMPNLSIVLLGVRDFLGQFYLGIDYYARLFSLRSY